MWKKRLESFKYAFAGIVDLVKTQPNAKIHLFIASFVILAGIFFSISITEWCLIIISISMVLAAEAFNTALEFLTDLVSPNYHQLAGKTKDVAAAGVLICAIGTALLGLVIFLPKIYQWLFV